MEKITNHWSEFSICLREDLGTVERFGPPSQSPESRRCDPHQIEGSLGMTIDQIPRQDSRELVGSTKDNSNDHLVFRFWRLEWAGQDDLVRIFNNTRYLRNSFSSNPRLFLPLDVNVLS
jgi:hypothetical protein